MAAPAFDHNHRTVVKEANALSQLLSFLDDADGHLFAGQDYRLHGVGQLVDVEDLYAFQFGHAVQVEVVGEDGAAVGGRQADQLAVHVGAVGVVDLHDLDGDVDLFLEPRQHLQAPAAAVAAQRVRRVGDVAQLVEDEAGGYQHALDEASPAR